MHIARFGKSYKKTEYIKCIRKKLIGVKVHASKFKTVLDSAVGLSLY